MKFLPLSDELQRRKFINMLYIFFNNVELSRKKLRKNEQG